MRLPLPALAAELVGLVEPAHLQQQPDEFLGDGVVVGNQFDHAFPVGDGLLHESLLVRCPRGGARAALTQLHAALEGLRVVRSQRTPPAQVRLCLGKLAGVLQTQRQRSENLNIVGIPVQRLPEQRFRIAKLGQFGGTKTFRPLDLRHVKGPEKGNPHRQHRANGQEQEQPASHWSQ
jgi:hypothetical protein